VEIDLCTNAQQRGAFARACVEIDLSSLLVPGTTVAIKGEEEAEFWQNFVYENVGTYCFGCGRIGHLRGDCQEQEGFMESDLCE